MNLSTPADDHDAYLAAFDSVTAETMRHSSRIKWTLFGDDVLPCWVADMDLPVAAPIHRRVSELVARHDFGYHRLPMSRRLRSAFIDKMAAFGLDVSPQQVYALVNVVQGLDLAITLFTEPGDGVLLITPIYGPFHEAVDGTGRRRVESALVRGEHRYEIDFDHLRSVVDSTTRLMLLCNPHNPTGRAFEREELEQLGRMALEHDMVIVSDEIHADLIYGDRVHIPIAALSPEIARRTITLTSATKAFNLAGLPCALAVLGSDVLKQRFRELPPHTVGHGGILGTEATVTAWTEGSVWLGALREYLDGNRRHLVQRIDSELPGVVVRAPEATYLAWLDCRSLGLEPDAHGFFLEQARVALSDGPDFASPGEGHVRLNFGTSRKILDPILDRMASALECR